MAAVQCSAVKKRSSHAFKVVTRNLAYTTLAIIQCERAPRRAIDHLPCFSGNISLAPFHEPPNLQQEPQQQQQLHEQLAKPHMQSMTCALNHAKQGCKVLSPLTTSNTRDLGFSEGHW